jgi:hypothetical protein
MDPIFIIGTERSGTNLLRLILNSHSHIAVPHPPHIMKFFSGNVSSYGDLAIDRNFRKLIKDVCRMVELHPYPWEIKPDRERIFREAEERDLIHIYFKIYKQYLEYTGKKRWACKSTFMIKHVEEVRRYFPDARFIYMVRDGRDVAVSAKTSIFNHYHIYYTARLWKSEQELGLSWMKKLTGKQIFLLKYEELINNTEETVKKLCSFLDEDFEEKMLEYYLHAESKKSGDLSISWENTSKPVIQENKDKFKTALTEKEVELFENIAFKELSALGYDLVNPAIRSEQKHDEAMRPHPEYRLGENFLFLKAEARHLLHDRNSLMRLKKIWFIKYIRFIRSF